MLLHGWLSLAGCSPQVPSIPEPSIVQTGDSGTRSVDTSPTGATAADTGMGCPADTWGPDCTPCACANGTCDDGIEGTGVCTCEEGWLGPACDFDCRASSGRTLEPDGSCSFGLPAAADAFVCDDDWAANNYGDDTRTLRAVGQQNDFTGNQIGRLLVSFDLPVLPEGGRFETAVVRLKQYDNFAGFPMTVGLYPLTAGFDEATVTWNDAPAAGPALLDSSTVGCCGEVHTFDVGLAVTAAVGAGDNTVGFQLASVDEGTVGGTRWWMREGEGVVINTIVGERPRIDLNVVIEPSSTNR